MTAHSTEQHASDLRDVTITYLGAQGDGAAVLADGQTLHIPYTLPGEVVRVAPTDSGKWTAREILTPSPDRTEPPCSLFGTCGGCTLQQMDRAALLVWKTDRVMTALKKAGFSDLPEPQAFQVPPHSRRRADLAMRRNGKEILLGLHARGSTDIIDLTTCPVLHPAIMDCLPALRQTFRSLEGLYRAGDVRINLLESGLDILLVTDGPLSTADRTRLASLSAEHAIPRICWQRQGDQGLPETAAQTRTVHHTLAGSTVSPPTGAFFQATAESEALIQQAVLDALPKLNKRDVVIELYAGCGTLSFPLASRARVQAYEGYPPAAAALKNASGGTRLEVACRDLNRQPIMAKELAQAGCVVLDPPHTGARLQMKQIAMGKPRHLIYVSCNPAALTKDAAALHAADYRLSSVTVIDQFLWSAEVEAVCGFRHESSRRSRTGLSHSG
ncbi:class I SAM-dependent RNA methyltransferase [Acetobacter persici]|uniref:23S rRNA methyltransferase n=1 Tax=Acetobacter persici TaxID=1076596 RepID=A0A1U9LGX6_9PROT|nr:class I SAM-dependent RNA methyltransferase [Acetobacter persici]AQT05706.1 23S rRNA methyltransferase [Acetobacter persici]